MNQWECDCGTKNVLSKRYCLQCNKEIPKSVIEQIFRDELERTKIEIKQDNIEKSKKRVGGQVHLMTKYYTTSLFAIILVIAVLGGVYDYFGYTNFDYIEAQTKELSSSVHIKNEEVFDKIKSIGTENKEFLDSQTSDLIYQNKEKIEYGIYQFRRLQIKRRIEELADYITK